MPSKRSRTKTSKKSVPSLTPEEIDTLSSAIQAYITYELVVEEMRQDVIDQEMERIESIQKKLGVVIIY